jgi:hypothetical protein
MSAAQGNLAQFLDMLERRFGTLELENKRLQLEIAEMKLAANAKKAADYFICDWPADLVTYCKPSILWF